MLNHAFVEDEKAPKRGETPGSPHHPPPVLPEHDGGGPSDLAYLNLSHFDGVHEHGHDKAHGSTHDVGHEGLADTVFFHGSFDF